MTKMVTRSSPNKGPDVDSPPKSQNLLKTPSSELCQFTDPEVDQFYARFPPNTVFRSFDSSIKSDSVSSTWVCFPAAPFQIGYSYCRNPRPLPREREPQTRAGGIGVY
ncbi:hypothetical protein Hanom_Chr11g01026081 [Helianthus anomalus]